MNRIFSGIRPSGKLHLGNYLGAIKNWIDLQGKPDTEQAIYAVVDLHGITTPYDPKTFHASVMDVILDYMAAGIDPQKSLLVRQSKLPHAELCWLFNTITPVSWLNRLPNYKEKLEQTRSTLKLGIFKDEKAKEEIISKVKKELAKKIMAEYGEDGFEKLSEENLNEILSTKKIEETIGNLIDEEVAKHGSDMANLMGILDYPVLMAADILLYKSNLVPVGDDQKAHIDLTNEIGKKFNHMFGETFEPVKTVKAEGARIMSLKDPTKKMSKTGDEGIALSDDPDAIREKIKKAVTTDDGITNLSTIYKLLANEEPKIEAGNYADFKTRLAEVVVEFLRPFQARRAELATDMGEVDNILNKSEEKAMLIAQTTLTEVRQKMGL